MSSSKPPSHWRGLRGYVTARTFLSALRQVQSGEVEDCDTPQRSTPWAPRRVVPKTGTINQVDLFPGWATKRPCISATGDYSGAFDLYIHISGVATSRRSALTRSQRTFLRIAKSFASLPKIPPTAVNQSLLFDIDEPRGLGLAPCPVEMPDGFEIQELERQFQESLEESDLPISRSSQSCLQQCAEEPQLSAQLQRLHDNLESRLLPFWASALSSRRVQVSIFVRCAGADHDPFSVQALLTRVLYTGSGGFFSHTFRIAWDEICVHPIGCRIAFDESCLEHELQIQAQVIEPEPAYEDQTPQPAVSCIPITQSVVRVISDIDDTVKLSRILDGARVVFHHVFVKDLEDTVIPGMVDWYNALWGRGARFHYVSNSPKELLPVIRRFIEISGLPHGSIRLHSYSARTLVNEMLSAPEERKRPNVVELLDHFPHSKFILVGDSGEKDMELYSRLAAERPTQIVGVFIRDVTASNLGDPTGKRAAEAMSNLPRPPRKASVLMPLPVAVSPPPPTTKRAMTELEPKTGAVPIPRVPPRRILSPPSFLLDSTPRGKSGVVSRGSVDSMSSEGSFSMRPTLSSSPTSFLPIRRGTVPPTEGEKKRIDLQNRVYKARLTIPDHIQFRVFEHPQECVEAEHIMEHLARVY